MNEYKDRDARLIESDHWKPGLRTQEPDEYDLIEREMDVVLLASLGRDQWEKFLKGTPVSITTSALEWWLEDTQRRDYPQLSQMAIDLLSIPAMSAEAERVFSGSRRQISWQRASLGAELIEKMECLKHWLTKSAVNTESLAIISDVIVQPSNDYGDSGGSNN